MVAHRLDPMERLRAETTRRRRELENVPERPAIIRDMATSLDMDPAVVEGFVEAFLGVLPSRSDATTELSRRETKPDLRVPE